MNKGETFIGQSGVEWRYWSDRPLGTPGGFGGVYEAEATDGTPMAVKVVEKVRPRGAIDDRLLRREIEIGKRIAEFGGDLLLPAVDVAESGTKLFLVMARADGGSLAEAASPLDDAQVASVLMDITGGLQQLHSIGIIHRDLKPANVLKHNGRWKLADFGIARDAEIGTQDPTFLGWGSSPYMAPEIWDLKSPTVKTDLYAVGCIAFELLNGQPPYTGDRDAIRTGHVSQPVPDVATGNTVLRSLVTRLLAKDPGERPQDARAVLDRLQRAVRPRSAAQEAIAEGLDIHATERGQQAAKEAAARAAQEATDQLLLQAQADLDEIIDDALENLQQIDPDIRVHRDHGGTAIRIANADAQLRIILWLTGGYGKVPGDTMILAAEVLIKNRRQGDLNAANVIYEQIGDRMGWQVYRFRPGLARPDTYTFGPYGRNHGLRHTDFFGRWGRPFMLNRAMHAWQLSVAQLTPQALLDLFREAVVLRPPDPQTGIWPGV
jgi:hypothetical protein